MDADGLRELGTECPTPQKIKHDRAETALPETHLAAQVGGAYLCVCGYWHRSASWRYVPEDLPAPDATHVARVHAMSSAAFRELVRSDARAAAPLLGAAALRHASLGGRWLRELRACLRELDESSARRQRDRSDAAEDWRRRVRQVRESILARMTEAGLAMELQGYPSGVCSDGSRRWRRADARRAAMDRLARRYALPYVALLHEECTVRGVPIPQAAAERYAEMAGALAEIAEWNRSAAVIALELMAAHEPLTPIRVVEALGGGMRSSMEAARHQGYLAGLEAARRAQSDS